MFPTCSSRVGCPNQPWRNSSSVRFLFFGAVVGWSKILCASQGLGHLGQVTPQALQPGTFVASTQKSKQIKHCSSASLSWAPRCRLLEVSASEIDDRFLLDIG